MTALTVRLPDEKHRRLKALAKSRGTPQNRLIDEMTTLMLAEFDAETRFAVRTARGTAGWVSREQMKQTVTEDGTPFELADPSLVDFLNRRFDFGAGYGASKKTSITRLWAGWRMSDTLSLDLNIAEVQSKTSTTGIWTASLLSEPWSDKRISPFFGVGVGRFHYEPNKSLVNREVLDGNMGALTLGVRYHLSGRAAVRIDYSRYSVLVSDTDYRNYQAGTIGLSIHF